MRFIFDFIIIFLLLLCAYWMHVIMRSFLNREDKQIKTKLLRIVILIFIALIFVSIFYGSFIEPQCLKIKVVPINLKRTAETENIKIVFLSDLHLGPYKQEAYLEKMVKKTIAENPDLIFLGGDFLFGKEKEANYLTPLKNLVEKFPVFAVTGNHEFNLGKYGDRKQTDMTKTLRNYFSQWGIKILDNETVMLTIQNKKIALSGIEDLWTGRANISKVRENIDPQNINILLSHNPDIILNADHTAFDLIISGHTHAGQIRLPILGSLANIPTTLGRKFDHGLFKLENNFLYISAGLGESGARARFFNPPEISMINLDL